LQRLTPIRRVAVGAVVAAVLWMCYFSHLNALGLVGPDEPRYAAVAREMAATRDWVTPRLYGKPWFEKPILYYWAAAAAFRVFGVSEFSARLPSALAAAMATLALGWLAWRCYGTGTAMATLLILPTSVAMVGFARGATPDMLFTAALTLALVCAARALLFAAETHEIKLWLLAFGAALGAATLAKGPAAVALAGSSVALWALVSRRWRDAFRLMHPWAIVAFAVFALPWYVLCALRNPDFVRVFLIAHNIERYLTPVFQHEQPFWFFGPVLLAAVVPWTILLVGVGRDTVRLWREKRWRDSRALFFACWVIAPVLFFSLSRSKLPGYVLPVVPALALLIARSITRAIEEKHPVARWLLAGVGITSMALAVGAGYWLRQQPEEMGFSNFNRLLTCTLAIMIPAIVVLSLTLMRRCWLALALCAVLVAGLIEGSNRWLIPSWDPYVSARATGQLFMLDGDLGREVSVYRLHRAWHYGLNYYAGRELAEWTPSQKRPAYVLTSTAGLRELERDGLRVHLVKGAGNSGQAFLVRVD
jgi:4-amino-4-deoxy-L-arabinose transferase-like glycosyltransferase